MKEEISEIVDKIADDLRTIAKKHGAWIVVVLVLFYVWEKVKK